MDKHLKDLIAPCYFSSQPGGAIKINWFCYELALVFFGEVMKNDALRNFRKMHTQEQIANMCVYCALKAKDSIRDKLSGKTPTTILYVDYIEEALPGIDTKTSGNLMAAQSGAWDSLLAVCEVCFERCISEKDRPSGMFGQLRTERAGELHEQGRAAMNADRPLAALELYNKALELDPDCAVKLGERGNINFLLNRHNDALTDLNRAIKLNPTLGTAHYIRGLTHRQLGNGAQAKKDLENARKFGVDP